MSFWLNYKNNGESIEREIVQNLESYIRGGNCSGLLGSMCPRRRSVFRNWRDITLVQMLG